MFFENISDIPQIAQNTGCAIFVLPDENTEIPIKNALILEPTDKTSITIDQVREMTSLLGAKQTSHQFIIIRPADKLGENAANALLKNLEEPKANYHFILITKNPSQLLPTILSRAHIYFLKTTSTLDSAPVADAEILNQAKKFITATPRNLSALADEIAKKKDRTYALEILAVSIDLLYKSYFKTGNSKFVQKIPKFLKSYENIEKNGHIKLHLVADLL